MKKKLAALLAAAMCLSVAPQSMHSVAAESTEPGISLLSCGAHMNTANRLQSRKKVSYSHEIVNVNGKAEVCVITGYEAVYVTYCTQCGTILYSRRELEDVQHSIVHN